MTSSRGASDFLLAGYPTELLGFCMSSILLDNGYEGSSPAKGSGSSQKRLALAPQHRFILKNTKVYAKLSNLNRLHFFTNFFTRIKKCQIACTGIRPDRIYGTGTGIRQVSIRCIPNVLTSTEKRGASLSFSRLVVPLA